MRLLCLLFAFWLPLSATASPPMTWLETLEDYPHAREIDRRESSVTDLEVGTGALQKVRGIWRFKSSQRLSGEVQRITWQIVDGFSAAEVFDTLQSEIGGAGAVSTVFSCTGRSCGPSVQWANRVFQQRLLYGRDDTQQYAVYVVGAEEEEVSTADWVMVMYAAGRTADRQYLHIDLLEVK